MNLFKKGKLCGLLSVLFITLGLSLSINLNDTSALKYAYNAFPLFRDIVTNYDNVGSNNSNYMFNNVGSRFSVTFDTTDQNYSLDDYYTDSHFEVCNNLSLANPSIISASTVSFRNQYIINSNQEFRKSLVNPNSFCGNSISYNYASSYALDYIYSSQYNLSNGDTMKIVDLSNAFFDVTEDGYDSGSIKSMTIPLTHNESLDHFLPNVPMSWDFGLVTPSANNFPYLSDTFVANLYVQYFTESEDSSSFSISYVNNSSNPISCSIDRNYRFQTRNIEEARDYMGFNVHCEFTPTTDVYYLHPSIVIAGDNSANPPKFLTYDYNHVYFTGTFLVTDNDDTWSGIVANPTPDGSDMPNSPSYHQLYGYEDQTGCIDGDFLCELGNLFSFNFLNPFAPIFNLFSNQNSCASIPIISSMIHSEETEVCPWFNSTVRNITTPVLGLASMMLIFGFAVRWLGASSGNLFEDSGSHDVGNISIKQRGK